MNYITFLTILIFSFSSSQIEKQGIKFEKLSIEAAIDKAKADNKMVFVAVTASWCGTCKFMKKNVFPSNTLESIYQEQFVSVNLDASNMFITPEIISEATWETLPALIYLNKEGKILKIVDGLQMDTKLLEIAEDLSSKK